MDVMDVICAFCEMGRVEEKELLRVTVEKPLKKRTYELPSGRKLTVVLEDEEKLVGVPA